jgi:hypothetical protein
MKGRKWLMAIDNLGYANYFTTRVYKNFFYWGRYKLEGDTLSKNIVDFYIIGTGFFTIFNDHFLFSRHF